MSGSTMMPEDISGALLARFGDWRTIYARHVTDLSRVNDSQEFTCRLPWADAHDNNPSMSVNNETGLWIDFTNREERRGNYIQFRSWLDGRRDANGRLIPISLSVIEDRVREELGIAPPSQEWMDAVRDALVYGEGNMAAVQAFKPWLPGTCYQLGVGLDVEQGWIVFPIHDENGRLINIRLYNPGATGEDGPKSRWGIAGIGGNHLFPHCARDENNLILVEGEPDAVTLRSFGFNACCGTQGAGAPVPPGRWSQGKDIAVLMDTDAAGQRASNLAVTQLSNTASSVIGLTLPDWPDRVGNADVSDWVQYMLSEGLSFDEIQAQIGALLERGAIVIRGRASLGEEPRRVRFSDITDTAAIGRRIEFMARVVAKGEKIYLGMSSYSMQCPARGHPFCRNCVMNITHDGWSDQEQDSRSVDMLRFISTPIDKLLGVVKEIHHIPPQCPDIRHIPTGYNAYQPIEMIGALSESEDAGDSDDSPIGERQRREAYVILTEGAGIEENRDYLLRGYAYPDPKSQTVVVVIDDYETMSTTAESFVMTEEIKQELMAFQPRDQNDVNAILDNMFARAEDLASSVTGIMGRPDLHIVMMNVWHSFTSFMMGPKKVNRGWLEALIVGDTRCGKSATFRALKDFFGCGILVDCKNQTVAGLLGAVNTSGQTGERYVTAGLFPQNDKGILGLDEMQGAKFGHSSLLEALAQTRSDGITRITKAAQAQWHARVRLLCFANPGRGKLIEETGLTGAELVNSIVPQPENVARFDIIAAVGQNDVDLRTINQAGALTVPRWSRESSRKLMSWIWSRRMDQVIMTPEAVEAAGIAAQMMCEKYDPSLPVVEPAEQRARIAKHAASIAGQNFSCDETGEICIILPSHVWAAKTEMEWIYDKPVMGYDRFSRSQRSRRQIDDSARIEAIIAGFGEYANDFLSQIMAEDEISERAFRVMAPGMKGAGALHALQAANCLRLVDRGRRDTYEKTPAFVRWIQARLGSGDGPPRTG